jgi:hypothetical protein
MACELFAGVNIHVFCLSWLMFTFTFMFSQNHLFYIETGKRELNLKIIFPLDLHKLISFDWPVLQFSRNRIKKNSLAELVPSYRFLGSLKF